MEGEEGNLENILEHKKANKGYQPKAEDKATFKWQSFHSAFLCFPTHF